MTFDELRYLCGDGLGYITLELAHRSHNGYSTRMLKTRGPSGRVCGVTIEGNSIVRFPCKVIIKWLDQQEKLGNR